jgi:hypothetical protein
MSYSSNSDVYQRFGQLNVREWANYDNLDDDPAAAAVTTNVTASATPAYAHINAALRCTPYRVPSVNESGTADPILTDIEATLRGVWLYEGHGVSDRDPEGKPQHLLSAAKEDALNKLEQIRTGQLKLDAV